MQPHASPDSLFQAAADAIRGAGALLIGAGAGMGVDSGLPDFRGPEGFWKAYPVFRGKQFAELSTPHWFKTDPHLAWGFFGHRLNLYRNAAPHAGFDILRRWAQRMPHGHFVFTSNVDGQFQKAGFDEDKILEVHGSIHHLQCVGACQRRIWSAGDVQVEVDPASIRAQSEPPQCPECGGLARPNILMFGDGAWDHARAAAQETRYRQWLHQTAPHCIVAVELGAGLAIPTVRNECEGRGQTLIRISPREPETAGGGIPLPVGALVALTKIDALLAVC